MQTKKQSILESAVNVISGLITSFAIQLVLFPILNIPVTINQNFIITAIFFVASFVRGYIIRRIFNKKSKNTEMIDFILNDYKENYYQIYSDANVKVKLRFFQKMYFEIHKKAKDLKSNK
jgi:ABC-type uncharacterized transport system permease subunit